MKWKDKTRGGHPVRIYAEDGGEPYPIHGAVDSGGGFQLAEWTQKGENVAEIKSEFDLVPTTPIIDWSKQPDWCKAVAKGLSGRWWRFDRVPYLSASRWDETGSFVQLAHPSEYPTFDGEWQDSLCVRPEGGAK